MDYQAESKKFEKLLENLTREYITPILKKHINTSPLPVNTNDLKHIILTQTGEIQATIDALDLILLLSEDEVPELLKNKKSEYLLFQIQCHLHELYILKEKLISFVNIIKKRYRKTINGDSYNSIFETINTSLSHVVNTRNGHVHSSRFHTYELNTLALAKLSCKYRINLEAEIEAELYFLDQQAQWSKQIRKNNEETKNLIEFCYGFIYTIITFKGDFAYPEEKAIY